MGGRLSSDPSLHILVVTTPNPHPTHLPNANRTSSKRPPLEAKALFPRKERIFSTENSQTRDLTLSTEQKACVPARGGWERAWQEFARLLRLLPRSAPKSAASAPGHFPSHPSRSRSCKLREAGSGHVNQPGPPAFRLHLPSLPFPPLKKNK